MTTTALAFWQRFRRRLRVARNATTLLGVLMIVTLWMFTAFHIKTQQDKALEAASHNASNLARVFEEHTIRSISGADRVMKLVRDSYTQSLETGVTEFVYQAIERISDVAVRVSIIGADGHVKSVGANARLAEINFSDREYFTVQAASSGDDLFISRPIVGKASGKWQLSLSRRITSLDGSFGGVVVGTLDPAELGRFYETIDIGRHGFISLIGEDGTIRARGGADANELGRKIVNMSLLDRARRQPSGNYWGKTADGRTRLITYRAVRDYPLIVTVALDQEEIFAAQQQNAFRYIMLAGGLSLLILGVVLVAIRYVARLRRTRKALHISEAEARAKSNELEVTLDHMQHGIMMIDPNMNIAVINKRAVEMLDLPKEMLSTRPRHSDIIEYLKRRGEFVEQNDPTGAKARELIANITELHEPRVFEGTRPNGATLRITSVPLKDGGVVRVFADVTQRKRDEAHVAYMIRHDALTGLANRVMLHERMTDAAGRLRRHKTPFSVLCLDLDRFKAVNDTLGHPVGDKLLQEVAKRLEACVREVDTVARFGGDEFTILLSNQGTRGDLDMIATRLVERIGAPYAIDGQTINVGTSIGIAVAPQDGVDPDLILKNADLALYKAKADGRNCFRYFDPAMDADMQSRRMVEMELRDAIANDELVLHYQPVVEISTSRIIGAEALIRWNHPQRGLIFPADFIGLAEESGLIGPVGDWVIRTACSEAAKWRNDARVAVNVSAAQFRRPDLVGVIAHALEQSGLPPHRLELEITESVLLQGDADHLETLELLSQLGIRIALDDFGTGYSSFSYLRMFKFDTIKIDRSFVRELPECSDCGAIIMAIAGLARTMGITTTAEGVENPQQLQWLKLAGCTHVQGYLFGKAIPAADFRKRLEAPAAQIQAA